VFLGMTADQSRSDQQHRAQAIESLRRFKVEIENNRAAVTNVKDYHIELRAQMIKYLDPKLRTTTPLRLSQGISPAAFEHTAWDLAIATQSLADIDPAISFELTKIYGSQQMYAQLSSGILQAMYLRPPEADWVAFLQSLKVYYDDVVRLEPKLLEMYGAILPMIDSALRD
jgi:hypothetical protein